MLETGGDTSHQNPYSGLFVSAAAECFRGQADSLPFCLPCVGGGEMIRDLNV